MGFTPYDIIPWPGSVQEAAPAGKQPAGSAVTGTPPAGCLACCACGSAPGRPAAAAPAQLSVWPPSSWAAPAAAWGSACLGRGGSQRGAVWRSAGLRLMSPLAACCQNCAALLPGSAGRKTCGPGACLECSTCCKAQGERSQQCMLDSIVHPPGSLVVGLNMSASQSLK